MDSETDIGIHLDIEKVTDISEMLMTSEGACYQLFKFTFAHRETKSRSFTMTVPYDFESGEWVLSSVRVSVDFPHVLRPWAYAHIKHSAPERFISKGASK